MGNKVQLVDYSDDQLSKEQIFCSPPSIASLVENLSHSLGADEVILPNLRTCGKLGISVDQHPSMRELLGW